MASRIYIKCLVGCKVETKYTHRISGANNMFLILHNMGKMIDSESANIYVHEDMINASETDVSNAHRDL